MNRYFLAATLTVALVTPALARVNSRVAHVFKDLITGVCEVEERETESVPTVGFKDLGGYASRDFAKKALANMPECSKAQPEGPEGPEGPRQKRELRAAEEECQKEVEKSTASLKALFSGSTDYFACMKARGYDVKK
jgi:hypothetical protein